MANHVEYKCRVWRLWTLKLAMYILQRNHNNILRYFDFKYKGVHHFILYWYE